MIELGLVQSGAVVPSGEWDGRSLLLFLLFNSGHIGSGATKPRDLLQSVKGEAELSLMNQEYFSLLTVQ